MRQARLIFKESTEIEDYLYGLLEEFLLDSKHEISLRIHAAKIINTATDINRRLKTLSQLLLEENNPQLHEVVLHQAQSIFQQSAETEESLYQPLEEFLLNSNHEISLRIHAAEIINTATDINRRLKTLSQLLLEENNPKLHEVALRQAQSIFQQSAETEESLYQPLEEFLLNSNHEISLRIHAAEIINTATDINRRLKTLSQLLLEENNPKLHEVALRQAQSIFQQSAETEESLYQPLEEFLLNSNHEISLRIHATEIINTATDINRRLKTLSQLLLEENNPKLHEVALRQAQSIFQQSAETEESLYQPLEEFLLNSNHEISLRIHAAEIINTATDINRRLKTLSQLLLEEKELRNATVRLLTPYKEELARVEPDADKVLEVLIVDQLNKPQLKDLTISQLKNYVSSTSGYHKEISEIFTSAITASKSLGKRYGRTSFHIERSSTK